ncbi:discoidin domain-containing protein [Microbacterium sp. zg-YB36]|uniref:discoidin domain-containing protein n=1 Tax=Microbacterium sp. zg-YB36 TaxID=2969407 RepID=UPI00214C2BA4|nr:discoidin domain-containing protein [Microbacterium sp. zg-YB36]MDL5351087.1 discoidin domain-containing protein [Microbacterium sp. zg-YB36]
MAEEEVSRGRRLRSWVLGHLDGIVKALVGAGVVAVAAAFFAPRPEPMCDDPGELQRVVPVSVEASSTYTEPGYEASNLIDGDLNSAWIEGMADHGEGVTLRVELPAGTDLALVCLANGWARSEALFARNATLATVEAATEHGVERRSLREKSPDELRVRQSIAIVPGRTDFVEFTLVSVHLPYEPVSGERDLALSELEFWAR